MFAQTVLPSIVLILPLQVFIAGHGDQGLLSGSIVSMERSWTQLNFQPENLYWILRFLARKVIEWKIWGRVTAVIVMLFLVNIRRLSLRKYLLQASLLVATLAIGASVTAYYYLASFTQELQYFLGTTANRLFMPIWVLAVLWSIMLAEQTEEAPSQAEREMGVKSCAIMTSVVIMNLELGSKGTLKMRVSTINEEVGSC